MTNEGADPHVDGRGRVTLRAVSVDHAMPESTSTYADWGERSADAAPVNLERWLIEVTNTAGDVVSAGDISAHPVWYGPTPGSRAMNIGISLVEQFRGHGIGATAQLLLAELLHRQGIVRVEASTDVENVPEQRALARAGFVLEGTLRQAQARADGLHDLRVWSHVAGTSSP